MGLSGSGIEIFLQNGAGGMDPGVLHGSNNADKVRIADMNNDGRMDIVGMGNFYPTDKVIDIFLQNADGTLPNQPQTYTVVEGFLEDMNVGDLNNDGRMDIVISGSMFGVPANFAVLTQQSDGTFDPSVFLDEGWSFPKGIVIKRPEWRRARGSCCHEFGKQPGCSDRDLLPEYIRRARCDQRPIRLYDCPEPVSIADVNNDGKNDIIVAHGGWQELGVLMQNADG